VLISSDVLQFFSTLQKHLKGDEELTELVMDIISQLCSLSSKIFENKEQKKKYISAVFFLLAELMKNNQNTKNRETILVSQIIQNFVSSFSISSIFSVNGFKDFLNFCSYFTLSGLKNLQNSLSNNTFHQDEENEDVEDSFEMKKFSILLSGFSSMSKNCSRLFFSNTSKKINKNRNEILDTLGSFTYLICEAYLQIRLEISKFDIFHERDDDNPSLLSTFDWEQFEEELIEISSLARLCLSKILPLVK
jgi:molybdopterin converting factor small subunit